VAWDDAGPELCEDGKEDRAGDGLNGLVIFLTVEVLYSSDEALYNRGLADGEG
jgi:hypothetical protein